MGWCESCVRDSVQSAARCARKDVACEANSVARRPTLGRMGVSAVAFSDRRVILRAVLAATLISAVGLSACGRKGALEPPPKADVTSGTTDGGGDAGGSGKNDNRPNHGFPLDFLL